MNDLWSAAVHRGVSVLNDPIVISAEWRSEAGLFQERLIKFFDILLPGALIGGGGKTFHTLLSTVGEVLKRVNPDQNHNEGNQGCNRSVLSLDLKYHEMAARQS